MQSQPSLPPKPVTEVWRPDLVALPRLTPARRLFRLLLRGLVRIIVRLAARLTVSGMENFPKRGPALIVINHLGDADALVVAASIPTTIDGLAKIELHEHWLAGPILSAYGVIWVHRGRPDRKALHAALDGLAEGRMVAIAPEGRESVSGGLEEGTEGAAFLAMKSRVPIVPIAITGTENKTIYGNMRRLKRSQITLRVGKPFFIQEQANRQETMREGTRQIMESLARLLPEPYRGNYKVS
ncbi:MAG TPA: lysophospholipid acyltransferase family protein [Anaerolineales bacterium]|nr:lysophospholipid acyltransferase family protein [Anaerolineales bacterium]